MAGVEVQYRPGSQPNRATAAAATADAAASISASVTRRGSPSARVALARHVPGCQRCHHGRHTPTRPIGIAIVPYGKARCRGPERELPLPARRLSCGTSGITGLVLIASAVLAGVVGLSYLVEALRPAPTIPTRLPWGPELKSAPVTIDGLTLRYVATGEGPSLLSCTLRTQLDMFQRTVHALAQTFASMPSIFPVTAIRTSQKRTWSPSCSCGQSVGSSMSSTRGRGRRRRIDPARRRPVARRSRPPTRQAGGRDQPYDTRPGRGTRRASVETSSWR